MENKSPGSGGGGGGGLSCISSSTQKLHHQSVGEKIVIAIGSGGSPDSTTQQSGIMSGKDNNSDHHGRGSASPAPGAGISDSHSAGGNGASSGNGRAPNMYSLVWNSQLLSLQKSLANLWDSGIGTDAVLLCQGTPLPVHKIVLTAASPYVASVVQTMAQASHMMPVIVVDIPAEAGKALLSFLYCGEAVVPVTIIPHLVLGAKFLGISGFGDPGVLESLTSIVPESVMTPDKTPPPSCDSPRQEPVLSESLRLPHFQLPIVPSHLMSSAVQINSNNNNNNNFRDNSNNRKKSDVSNASSEASSRDQPQHLLQFNHHHQLHQQIAMGKARIPYGSPYSTSSSSSGGEVINLTKNKTSGGSYSTFATKNTGGKSPKSQTGSVSGGASTNSNRVFVGTTSILDNLLKNPRTHLEAAIAAAAAAAAASAHNAHNNNDNSDNNDMVQYEAEGYADAQSSPHNLSASHLIQQQREGNERGYYYSPGSAGHPAFTSSGNDNDDGDNNMEMTMTEESTPIPAHLLEPNVEYRVPQEYADRYGLLHNPLADLAKVAAASIQHQPATVGKRGSKKNQQQQQQQQAADGNGVDDITSTGKQANTTPAPTPKKAKKNPDSIICEICGKKFSNAYNLRVHMEGHSGQVFVCSVCSHASRSRDALRKHFAYRHRELWISGMSAFRKNVPGRKLSISKNNNNNNDAINNNMKVETSDSTGGSAVDANGNMANLDSKVISIRGSDGTLSISEAK